MSGLQYTVGRISELSNKVAAGEPGVGRFIQGAQNWVGAKAQTDQDAAELDTMGKAYANILNRSLLQEKGVITDADRQFAIAAIPSIWDTLERRQRKMLTFKNMSELMMWGEEQLAQGKLDVPAFRQKLQAMQQQANNPQGQTGGGRLVPIQ
jgi:hypothetical protein